MKPLHFQPPICLWVSGKLSRDRKDCKLKVIFSGGTSISTMILLLFWGSDIITSMNLECISIMPAINIKNFIISILHNTSIICMVKKSQSTIFSEMLRTKLLSALSFFTNYWSFFKIFFIRCCITWLGMYIIIDKFTIISTIYFKLKNIFF